ncbi:Asp23/Gls24 family envelope stress response protein [Microbacterium protaetiae]|uniref:Asp23/Gls24 family envelope stress response protein n=1 Tax=Microbacterium protaetiae TaxID=2509458 RepID=A0A4V0YDF0_9MICO|nr:Asp23/Gls24 family envelope stress response protein [Microbacterium protaetiae]QAY60481.1 Asp23/Gls24 family envelope stress response protein [Microbacterium protaetiae]
MTAERPDPRRLGVEPGDLDGHTIEELTDYLEAGRSPSDPSIEQSAGCQLALEALERLHSLTPELMAADAAAEPAADESWVQKILSGIALDARAGRRIPLTPPAPGAEIALTEGAVRGLVRAAENAIPGVLIGRCRLNGDVTTPGAPVRIEIDASVPYGEPLPRLADRLRDEIARRLAVHTELNVTGIDIRIHDVQLIVPAADEEDEG